MSGEFTSCFFNVDLAAKVDESCCIAMIGKKQIGSAWSRGLCMISRYIMSVNHVSTEASVGKVTFAKQGPRLEEIEICSIRCHFLDQSRKTMLYPHLHFQMHCLKLLNKKGTSRPGRPVRRCGSKAHSVTREKRES